MRNAEIEKLRSKLSQKRPRRRRSRSPSGGSYVVKTPSRRNSYRGGSRHRRQKNKRKSSRCARGGRSRRQRSVYGGIRIKDVSERRMRRGRNKTADDTETESNADGNQTEAYHVEPKKKKQRRRGKSRRSSYEQEDSEDYLPGTSRGDNDESEIDYEV